MAIHFEDGVMLEDVITFDLQSEMRSAQESRPWHRGRFTKLLLKKDDLRLLLISLEAGCSLKEHHADGTIAIQVVRGSIEVIAQQQTHILPVRAVLTLSASIKHEVRAIEDAVFLLTIAWPAGESLKSLEHRGY